MIKPRIFGILIVFVMLSVSLGYAGDARLQIIHNAADPALDMVDVYVNGQLQLDDFQFRSATPFINVPGGVLIDVPDPSCGKDNLIGEKCFHPILMTVEGVNPHHFARGVNFLIIF